MSTVLNRWITIRKACAGQLVHPVSTIRDTSPTHRPQQGNVHLCTETFWVSTLEILCFSLVQQPPMGQGLLIHEVSRSHTTTRQSVRLLWTSDQLVALGNSLVKQNQITAGQRVVCQVKARLQNAAACCHTTA